MAVLHGLAVDIHCLDRSRLGLNSTVWTEIRNTHIASLDMCYPNLTHGGGDSQTANEPHSGYLQTLLGAIQDLYKSTRFVKCGR